MVGGQTLPGNSSTPPFYYTSAYITKSDLNGNYLWFKTLFSRGTEVMDAQIDNKGNIVACGTYNDYLVIGDTIFNNNNPQRFFFIAKFSTNGNVLWAKTSTPVDIWSSANICFDPEGNIYCTSSAEGIAFGSNIIPSSGGINIPNVFVVKFSPNGNFISGFNIGGATSEHYERPYLILTPNKDIIVSLSVSTNYIQGYSRYELYKFNNAGNQQWVKQIPIGTPINLGPSPSLKADYTIIFTWPAFSNIASILAPLT